MTTQQTQQATPEAAARPVTTFRHGAIGASIWAQKTAGGEEFYNFTLSRSWKSDATGKSGYSGSFSERNGEDLYKTIKDCVQWIQANGKTVEATEASKSENTLGSDASF